MGKRTVFDQGLENELAAGVDFFAGEMTHWNAGSRLEELHKEVLQYRGLVRGLLFALASAIDTKDPRTHGHSVRVGTIAVLLGKELKRPSRELETLEFGGLLHDLGKIGLPEPLLETGATWSAADEALIRSHPEQGDRILSRVPGLEAIREIIRHHHERWDGQGFPDGLRGKEIPLTARIVAVANRFDSLAEHTSGGKSRSLDSTLQKMAEEAQSSLDGRVVEALIHVAAEGLLRIGKERCAGIAIERPTSFYP